MQVKNGDRIAIESEHVGDGSREGRVLDVIGSGDGVHYRVKWDDGHESVVFPTAGSITIIPKAAKTSR